MPVAEARSFAVPMGSCATLMWRGALCLINATTSSLRVPSPPPATRVSYLEYKWNKGMTAQWQHYAAATIDFQQKPNSIRLTRSLARGTYPLASGSERVAGPALRESVKRTGEGGGAICTSSDWQVLYCRALDSTVPLGSQRMGLWFLCHLLVFAPHFHGLPDKLVNISRVSDSHLLLHRTHIFTYYLLIY